MISYSELKRGIKILMNNQPYEILESAPMFKGRGHSVLQTKIKNLITGEAVSHTFRPADEFEEPDIEKKELKFIYKHLQKKSSISNGASQEKYVFSEKDNPSKRFELLGKQIGKAANFLKPNQIVNGLFFSQKLISITLPVKIELKVAEAAPAIKGQSAQVGTKPVILETGAKINTPLFIESGDAIEVNTETGEYVRRIG